MTAKVEKVLKGAAIYDVAATALLIVQPLVPFVLELIALADSWFGFSTSFALPDRTTIFFINLAAASVVAWAVIRILRPSREALLVDVGYRVVLVGCQVWAVLEGATPILLGISAVLLLIAGIEWLVWRQSDPKTRRATATA